MIRVIYESYTELSLIRGNKEKSSTRHHYENIWRKRRRMVILIVHVMLNSVSTPLFGLGTIPSDYMVHFVTDTFQQL